MPNVCVAQCCAPSHLLDTASLGSAARLRVLMLDVSGIQTKLAVFDGAAKLALFEFRLQRQLAPTMYVYHHRCFQPPVLACRAGGC